MTLKIIALTAAITLASATSAFAATFTIDSLNFSTSSPQSSFGSGGADEVSGTVRSTQSLNGTESIGFVEDIGLIPNPEWFAREAVYQTADVFYDAANSTYQGLNSAYSAARSVARDCLDSFVGNPVTCSIPIGARVAAKGLRDGALAVRREASTARSDALTARNAVPNQLDGGFVGTDARITTSGEIGVELSYNLSAGSVNPTLQYSVGAEIPDVVDAGQVFSFGATSSLNEGTINSTSATFEAELNQIIDLKIDASGRVCAVACETASGNIVDINESLELVKIEPAEITLFDGLIGLIDPTRTAKLTLPLASATVEVAVLGSALGVTVNNIPVDGFPDLEASIDVAEAVISVPVIKSIGALDGDVVRSEASEQFIALTVDIDGILPQLPPGGFNGSFGPQQLLGGFSIDAFDIDAGPTLSMLQEFELSSTLMVDLRLAGAATYEKFVGRRQVTEYACQGSPSFPICGQFPVIVDGNFVYEIIYETVATDRWIGAWDDLPDFAIFETTIFSPTFFVDAALTNLTSLQLALGLGVEFGKGSINLGPLEGTIGPLFDESWEFGPDGGITPIFTSHFALDGWNSFEGEAFTIRTTGSMPVSAVPLPASSLMIVTGLLGLVLMRRRRTTLLSS
jgi:hypothetical protein